MQDVWYLLCYFNTSASSLTTALRKKKIKNIWASKIFTVLQRFISLHTNPRLVLFFNLVKYLIETFLSLDS